MRALMILFISVFPLFMMGQEVWSNQGSVLVIISSEYK